MKTLDGIQVVDLSHAAAGPSCTMLLADMGAKVIRIEHPHGDHFRPVLGGAVHAAINRNKYGISLDLKREESMEIMKRLIRKGDVIIESFIPGTVEKMGLGYEAVKAINPRIIYCSISGFGQTGPYKDLPGYDVVAQAMAGIMMCTGEPDRPPVRIGPSLIDMGSGMYMTIGILAALMERERTGKGQRLETSLLETALSWMSHFTARYSMTGELPQRFGSGLAAFSPYQVYEVSDGYVFIGVSTERFWRNFCQALGFEMLVEDPQFLSTKERVKNRGKLNEIIENSIKKRKVTEVIEKLRKAGVPCAPVCTLKEIINDPHVKERDFLVPFNTPEHGEILLTRTPIVFSGKMPEISLPSPLLGQHTCEVLKDLDFTDEEINKFITSGVAFQDKQGKNS